MHVSTISVTRGLLACVNTLVNKAQSDSDSDSDLQTVI